MGIAKAAFNGVTGVVGGAFDAVGDNLSVAVRVNELKMAEAKGLGKVGALATGAFNMATGGIAGRIANGISHKDMVAMDDMNKYERKVYLANKDQKKAKDTFDRAGKFKQKAAAKANRKGIDLSLSNTSSDELSL